VQVRFLLGPSGTGKTFRCLTEIRSALLASPAGPPLVFLAPKQATFQLERQLLADSRVPGYTRLQILSFDQLAELILSGFQQSPVRLLNEDGRLMVLRALLAQKRNELKLFRSTARLRGFAQQLSAALRDIQRSQVPPSELIALAAKIGSETALGCKLQDVATMLSAYLDWLREHHLHDQDLLVDLAAEALSESMGVRTASPKPFYQAKESARTNGPAPRRHFRTLHIAGLWFDGFAELAAQEIALLTALLPCCDRATLAFNLDRESLSGVSWLSTWSAVGRTFQKLQQRLAEQPDTDVIVEWLDRAEGQGRFRENPILRHLEENWAHPKSFDNAMGARTAKSASETVETAKTPADAAVRAPGAVSSHPAELAETLRAAICANPEAEATLAAREILRFVRSGGRYRDVAVVVRELENYYEPVRRILARYGIPFFLDRREPVGRHPLAELIRSALRTIALHWQHEDWFGALKTGLVHNEETEIDFLENEALARGWKGEDWFGPLTIKDDPRLADRIEKLRIKLLAPFQELMEALGVQANLGAAESRTSAGINGNALADALRIFWRRLKIGEQMAELSTGSGNPMHVTLWRQMQEWLDNLTLAFSSETLTLREWLPILEAGLASQTVGVIPPALDQVLVGAIDRSRNPDLKLAIILGMNESVFPAAPTGSALLTDAEREQLSQLGVELGQTVRSRLAQEHYLGYIACTRSRQRLVLTCARRDDNENALNPSPFLAHLRRLFPSLQIESYASGFSWIESEHVCELAGPLWRRAADEPAETEPFASLIKLPAFEHLWKRLEHLPRDAGGIGQSLSPVLAERLYGAVLRTSVSGLEEFAACPFKFFVSSGLKAKERQRFELDAREQGSFQHEILARFHRQLRTEGKRWRELTPDEARERIGQIAEEIIPNYRDGLLQASGQANFAARSLTASLQSFIHTIIGWMAQYQFDPYAVELAFGIEEKPLPAWDLDLGKGHSLSLRGKIDRVDLWRRPEADEAFCVVIDYKSSARKLDPLLLAHGIQLQLPAYLNVLRGLSNPRSIFGVGRLIPAGVFFVNLRGAYDGAKTRQEVFERFADARKSAYRHAGRFDAELRTKLDSRAGVDEGDQFSYRLAGNGAIHGSCREPMTAHDFATMLDAVEGHLRRMGQAIYAGEAKPDPYRKGFDLPCQRCVYQSICRIDPWTHSYRVLRKIG